MKHKPSQDNLWPHAYSREGKPIVNKPSNLYGDLFLANGLSEYSKATKDANYFQLAKEILIKCLKIYDNADYYYDVYYGPKVEQQKGQRVLGHWMVILRLVTQMLETKPDPELEKIVDRCIQAIMNKHRNPEFDLINEVLDHDMTLPDNAFAQFVYTGHAIETLWMVLYEAARKKDIALFKEASRCFKRHLEVAWDDVYGGAFRCLIHVDDNIWEVDKVLWLQEEILIGLLFIIEHSGAQWAIDWFDTMYSYVKEKYPLKQYGLPLWILGGDRKVTFERDSERVGNFHHPRHLMLNLLSLKRIIKRKGVVSDLFAKI
jgi:mannose/cellobiose epimerase-like protein (N-acyl-D-glucosamine 2-epimerase family)